jgi:hypothetical protein
MSAKEDDKKSDEPILQFNLYIMCNILVPWSEIVINSTHNKII